jgi:gas vesicle protein
MSDNRDELGAFLIGFVVGGLAGAITALLLAPQSGEETRTVIKDKAIELRDKAGKSMDEAYAQAEAAAAEARGRFEELAAMAKERAVDVQKRGQVLVEKIRKGGTPGPAELSDSPALEG